MRLTPAEIQSGIGIKSLIIVKDNQGRIARVMSPVSCVYWTHDGATWTLQANTEPATDNTAGVYVTYRTTEARKYHGVTCKVILSGTVIEHEHGARGQNARLLEVEK
jgi:hypothetical protein